MNEKEVEDELKGFQTKIDKLTKELENSVEKVNSGQQLLDKHKQEMGEARKEIKEQVLAVTKAKEEGEIGEKKYNELLEKLETVSGKLGSLTDSSGGGGTDDTVAGLKKSLTPEQMKAADEAFNKLADEDKQVLLANDAEMKKFLGTAKLALPSIPKSLFDEGDPNGNSEPDRYAKLFGIADKQSSATPASRRGGPSGFADASNRGGDQGQQSESRMLANGIIPRPVAVT